MATYYTEEGLILLLQKKSDQKGRKRAWAIYRKEIELIIGQSNGWSLFQKYSFSEYARAVLGNYDNRGLKNIITRMPDIIDKWRELDNQVTRNDVMMMIVSNAITV